MRTALFLVFASACLKPVPVPQAAQPTDVAVIYALGLYESGEVEAMPDHVQERVTEELEARNLVPATMPSPANFATVREPVARLATIQGARSPVLLVSCDPRFDTQVNGRFRWSVPCDVAIGSVTGHIEPSAHLVYYHQGEADAVLEVQTQIAREAARVLDQWLNQAPAQAATPTAPSTTGPRPL